MATKAKTTNPFAQPAKTAGKAAPVGTGTVLAPAAAAPAVSYAPSGDGGGGGYVGGGGGGGGAAGAVGAIAVPSFDQYIANDFGYRQAENENTRRLNDFDAETLRGRQQTEAEQGLRRTALQQVLQDAGGEWAGDTADRGLLRSGLYQQGQDRFVDQRGVQGNQDIDQLLSEFISNRGAGRIQEEASGRNALNEVLSRLSADYNKSYVNPNVILS